MFLAILTHILCRGFRFFQALTGFNVSPAIAAHPEKTVEYFI